MDNKNLLDDICYHCNNFFNQKNDPAADRAYPDNFLELAKRIEGFIESVGERNNVTASRVGTGSENVNLEYASWQKTYARELAIWKRARFI